MTVEVINSPPIQVTIDESYQGTNLEIISDSSVSLSLISGPALELIINPPEVIGLTLENAQGPAGPAGINSINEIIFSESGEMITGAGQIRWYFDEPAVLKKVIISVTYAPLGSSAIFDVNKNSSSIYTNQANRPTITSGSFVSNSILPDVINFAAGDSLSVDVDQVGSEFAGAEIVVRIILN